MDELSLFATTWMQLTSIIWNKSYTQNSIYFMTLFIQNSKAGKTPAQQQKPKQGLCLVGLVTKRDMREVSETGNSLFLDLDGSQLHDSENLLDYIVKIYALFCTYFWLLFLKCLLKIKIRLQTSSVAWFYICKPVQKICAEHT